MENQERYYKSHTLNRIFAFASVALFIALIALFYDDYSREWKAYQQKFRKLEIEKTRLRYKEEVDRLKAEDEYQGLLRKIDSAKTQLNAKTKDLQPLQRELLKLSSQYDLAQQSYQFVKAHLAAAKYEYEAAVASRSPDTRAKEKNLSELTQKTEELRIKVETAKQGMDDQSAKMQEIGAAVKQLEKEKSTLAKQAEILEKKLKHIDPKEMSLANHIAEAARNLPILDFLNPTYKIDQIVVKDITDDVNFMRVPKVDRCMTCHQGILSPGFEDAPQPFRTHPKLEIFLSSNSPHPLDEFGCTSCHGGRGRGTDFFSAAHTPSTEEQKQEWEKKYHWHAFHYWETPMLPKKYVEAGCFKCHSDQSVIKGAEKLNLGLNLIEKAGCFGCHAIERYKDWPKVGPDLTHLSSKTTKEWAYQWIENPKTFRHNTWMPSFFGQSNTNDEASRKRAEQEIHAIVQFLFKGKDNFELKEIPVAGDAKKGEELVSSLGCFGCHAIEPTASPTRKITQQSLRREHGPNLIGMGNKTSPQWIYNWLKDPNRYHPNTRMPNLRLSDEEAAHITAYLSAENVAGTGNKALPPVDQKILRDIVYDFLIKSESVADANKQLEHMIDNEKLEFAGQKLIKHYGCFGCHVIPGFENEKPIGTDLTEEGSKSAHKLDFGFVDIDHSPQAWFAQKLKDPRIFDNDRVRAPDEKLKMPNFNFTDEEIEAIVTALMGFVKDKPAAAKMFPQTPKNEAIAEGQRLVREFNCQGCHIMEGEGGAIQPMVAEWLMKFDNRSESEASAMTTSFSPPNLIGEGKKVQAEWLFHFIHNPQTIRPWLRVRMPTFAFSDAQINALLKYFNYLDDEDFPFATPAHEEIASDELAAGAKLFSKDYLNCASCHIVGAKMPAGSPDSWAPNFALAQKRLKPEWIIEWLKNPQGLQPGTKMPTFFDPAYFDSTGPDDILGGDENKQIKALRDYILTLTGNEDAGTPTPPPPQPQSK